MLRKVVLLLLIFTSFITCSKIKDYSYNQIKTELLKNNISTNDLINPIEINEEIKLLAHKLAEGKTTAIEKAESIYNYLISNIRYNTNFKKEKEQTAIETFKSKKANCTQYSYLFIATARELGLKAYFVDVYIDSQNQITDHACVGLFSNNEYILIDPTYANFNIKHIRYKILNDKEMLGSFYNNLATYYTFRYDKNKLSIIYEISELLFNKNPKLFCNIGRFHYKEKKYQTAIKYFTTGIDIYNKLKINHPDIKKSYFDSGYSYSKLKKYKLSIKWYKKATMTLPISNYEYITYFNIGRNYLDLKEYNKALFYIEKAANINPDYSYAYNTIGWLYYIRCDFLEAESNFEQAINKNENHIQAILNLATLLAITKRYNEAFELLNKSINRNPENYRLYNSLSYCYYLKKDYHNAKKYAQKTLELKQDYIYAIKNLILILIKLNDFKNAKLYLDKNISIDKNKNDYYYIYSIYYSALENKRKAIEFLQQIDIDHFSYPISIKLFLEKEDGFYNIRNDKEFISIVNDFKKTAVKF